MTAWLAWSAAAYHWALYVVAALLAGFGIVLWLYFHEPAADVAEFDAALDRQDRSYFTGHPSYSDLPGPATEAPARAGEFQTGLQYAPELDPMLRPGWLDDQLEAGRAWLARQVYLQGKRHAQDMAETIAWAA